VVGFLNTSLEECRGIYGEELKGDEYVKIWRVEVDFGENEEYEELQLANTNDRFLAEFEEDIAACKKTNGKYHKSDVNIIGGSIESDHPKLWNAMETMVISKQALNKLEVILSDGVEVIPLNCDNREYCILNILSILDAVDYDNAEFERLSTGLIVGLEKYSFLLDKIGDNHIFKILVNDVVQETEIFVSDLFKKCIEEHELSGFKFEEAWDSED